MGWCCWCVGGQAVLMAQNKGFKLEPCLEEERLATIRAIPPASNLYYAGFLVLGWF